jgi:hypothetical protein
MEVAAEDLLGSETAENAAQSSAPETANSSLPQSSPPTGQEARQLSTGGDIDTESAGSTENTQPGNPAGTETTADDRDAEDGTDDDAEADENSSQQNADKGRAPSESADLSPTSDEDASEGEESSNIGAGQEKYSPQSGTDTGANSS